MTTPNITTLLNSFQPLRTYLRQNLTHLRSTPCLMITSSKDVAHSQKETTQQDAKVHAFVQRNTQSVLSEFNLRAVPITATSAFPTLENVNDAITLAKRAGLKPSGGVIVGIGSGPAMDLAKAVSDRIHGFGGRDGKLILAPATLGGVWAASSKSSPSLLLDTKEEMLLPCQRPEHVCQREVVMALDSMDTIAIPPLFSAWTSRGRGKASPDLSLAHVAGAALSIVLDLARFVDAQQSGLDGEDCARQIKSVASSCAAFLEAAAMESKSLDTNNTVVNDSTRTTVGYEHGAMLIETILTLSSLMDQSMITHSSIASSEMTTPQQLANALLPTYFPQSHILTFMACTLPGICSALASHTAASTSLVGEVAQTILTDSTVHDHPTGESSLAALSTWATNITQEAGIPTMASLAFGTPGLNALLEKLDAYTALMESECNGIGGGRSHERSFLLEDVLERSLNR